jgi:hypothetical protein
MKNRFIKFILLYALLSTISCTPPAETSSAAAYCYGFLSSEVVSYSKNEMTLKTKFYVFDSKNADQLTTKNIENNLSLNSTNVDGILTDFKEIVTPGAGNYSCAVLVDEIFNIVNCDYATGSSFTDIFLRKYFKNAGKNNSFLFSTFSPEKPDVNIYGNGFTTNASELDLTLASVLNNKNKNTEERPRSYLLQSIDNLMETINKTSTVKNRHLLLLSSNNGYVTTGITIDSIKNKAKRYGIKISTIMDRIVEDYFEYDLKNEDLFFDLADYTGGFVYDDDLGDMSYDNNILILAARMGNMMEGNFRCFESTWKILPSDSWTKPFQPGFTDEGTLDIDLGTQYISYGIQVPYRINIK